MRMLPRIAGVVLSTLIAMPAIAQTPAPSGAPKDAAPAAAAAPASKRAGCQASVQALSGQDKRDQMQLCMAQARTDCLKQAIDQKVVGPQRKDFVTKCVGGE